MIQPDGTAHGVEVDVGANRNVGGAVADAAAVEVSVATAPVAASVGVEGNVGGMIGNGVAVSARGMINGGSVALSTNVGVNAAPRGVGVRDES